MASILHPLNRHIADIKRRLLIIGATIMVAFVVAFTFSSALIEWFKRPFADDLLFYGPAEALFASIKISFLAGVVASFPVILHQFWRFIQPALLVRERRWAIPLFLWHPAFSFWVSWSAISLSFPWSSTFLSRLGWNGK